MNLTKAFTIGALSFSALLIGGCSSNKTQSKDTASSSLTVKKVSPEEKNAQNLAKIINEHPLSYRMKVDNLERYDGVASKVKDASGVNISNDQDTIMPAPKKAEYLTTLAEKYFMNDGEFAALEELAGDPDSYSRQLKGKNRPKPEIKSDELRGGIWKDITLLYGTLHDAKVSKDVNGDPTVITTRTVHYQTEDSSEKTVSKKITVQVYGDKGTSDIKKAKTVE